MESDVWGWDGPAAVGVVVVPEAKFCLKRAAISAFWSADDEEATAVDEDGGNDGPVSSAVLFFFFFPNLIPASMVWRMDGDYDASLIVWWK